MKTSTVLSTAGLGLALGATSVFADSNSPYTSFTAFGDSLTDTGQFPDAGAPLANGNPIHGYRPTNRVGPNYKADNTELTGAIASGILAEKLGVGPLLPSTPIIGEAITGIPAGSNYAVGGYVTQQVLNSITAPNGSQVVAGEALISTRNGYLIDFPQADPTGMYWVNGGGNDLARGIISSPEAAAASAKNMADGVAALAAAGANYIMVPSLPNVGLAPALNTYQTRLAVLQATGASDEAIAPVAGAAKVEATTKLFAGVGAGWYNASLDAQLNATGANVIRFDVYSLFNEIMEKPEDYGLDAGTNLSGYTFDGSDGTVEHPVHGINGTNPNPDALLFNDRLHPTTSAQAALADYYHSILAAPFEIGLLPEQALGAARNHTASVHREVNAPREGWQSFVSLGGGWAELGQASASVSGDTDEVAGLVGITKACGGPLSVGLAYSRVLSDLEAGYGSDYSMSADLITPLVKLQSGKLSATGTVGYGYLDYKLLERGVQVGQSHRTHRGNSEGELFTASLQFSYTLPSWIEGLTLGPIAGIDYYDIEVDGYREEGRASTALHFGDQSRESLQWQIGAFANHQLNEQWQLDAQALYRAETEDDTRSLELGLNSMSGANDFSLIAFTPEDDAISASVGLRGQLAENVQIGIGYGYIGSDDYSNLHNGNVSFNVNF